MTSPSNCFGSSCESGSYRESFSRSRYQSSLTAIPREPWQATLILFLTGSAGQPRWRGPEASMAFNLPHFLRRTPRHNLRAYFRFRSIGLAADFDWSAAQKNYLLRFRAEVELLPDNLRE